MNAKAISLLSILVISLCACAPKIDKRGKALDPNDLKQLHLARHTKADVQRLIGSPTLVDKFDEDTWFYLYRFTETTAFLNSEEKKMKIVAVKFNKSGILENIKTSGESGTRSINIVDRETPTRGRNTGYLEQIFGNFGRIHRGDAPGT